MIRTSYFPQKGDFDIAWPGRVARHDLVYQAPPSDPMQYGMPIGNGDIGALLWCDDRKIIIAVNKCDLWDDSPYDEIQGKEQDEERTSLRHACRIIIDFGMPVFDTFYLKDFNGRLRLQDGCIVLQLDTPFGSLSAEFFVAYDKNVICARVRTDFGADDGVKVTLERYGSRNYSYWFAYQKRDPSIGLGNTDTACKDGNLLLKHKLTTGPFVCALRPVGEGFRTKRRTCYMASAIAEVCPKEFTFFATVTTPLDARYDEAYAMSVLDAAAAEGFDALLAHNEACWKKFWEVSFLETDDDYLDNLWHLSMYYACCGQRGRYPGRFINSLWGWNRDVQPWNYYFHWNQQEAYWGLNAAGHHELCDAYLNYRFACIPLAEKTAREWYGVSNALFVSDIADRNGLNSRYFGDWANHTPVGEIALDFWRQYRYTCDLQFLKEKALPYMLGAARFMASLFVKEPDGRYHAKGGTPYEGDDVLYDVVTEVSVAKALFPAVMTALALTGQTDPDAAIWQEMAEKLADYALVELDPCMTRDNGDGTYTLQRGVFEGGTVNATKVISVGRFDQGMQPFHEDMKYNGEYLCDYNALKGKYIPHFMPVKGDLSKPAMDGVTVIRKALVEGGVAPNAKPQSVLRAVWGHPQATICPVFPSNVVGLKDRGTDLFDAAVTTAKTIRSHTTSSNSWDPEPIVLARLGLTEEVDTYLYEFPSNWQFYNNGFMHYGPTIGFLPVANLPFARTMVLNAENPEAPKFCAETFPFRHMGLEPLGVLSATMNERLLQSHDGVIRIAPAYGKRSARFKLHAVGGFEVMAQIREGEAEFVAIRSRFGKPLRLENPWQAAFCGDVCYEEKEICLATEAGATYVFTPTAEANFASEAEAPEANRAPKARPDRFAMLGMERCF